MSSRCFLGPRFNVSPKGRFLLRHRGLLWEGQLLNHPRGAVPVRLERAGAQV